MTLRSLIAGILSLATAGAYAAAGDAEHSSYSPFANKQYPQEVYWGDTHLHSAWSFDANLFGNYELSPADAFRFARGEVVTATHGGKAKIDRPLDFLVIADHAEYLGLMPLVRQGDADILATQTGQRWYDYVQKGPAELGKAMLEVVDSYARGVPLITVPENRESPWVQINRMADVANKPGIFTALAGFEWSPTPDGNNLHRVVMFRDDADRITQVQPFSTFDSKQPEALWKYLANYEQQTGGQALAIPHNSNLSGGLMFAETDSEGNKLDAAYARERSRWEPVVEVTQIKGDSETHPRLSPSDAFADYGTWDQTNIALTEKQQPWMQQYQYARSALLLGLKQSERIGENPFRFGMIGSSDSHTSLAAVEEDNFWGKLASQEPSPQRVLGNYSHNAAVAVIPNTAMLSSGFAAVWATENTRSALFDAMRRREVYASTGPRMTVRFFGGWRYSEQDLFGAHPALAGYSKGVPMGSRLARSPQGGKKAPVFMLWALKDQDGANLDRLQIVKGWVDNKGQPREHVYNVAWSGDRMTDRQGQLAPVGNTVDLENASFSNSIGAAQLITLWSDPEFDPQRPAFYYVRVLEIPTPRWPVYDSKRFGVELPEGTELIHQERAYTSPIWYEP